MPNRCGQVWVCVFVCLFKVLSSCGDAGAEALVIKVVDGDSIVVQSGRENKQIRLWGIDAPEYRQPYAKAAKRYMEKLLKNQEVRLQVKDLDVYGRTVAVVYLADGRNASEELLKAGLAWVHVYYCRDEICDRWKSYEDAARKKKTGLWRAEHHVAPWVWKRKHRQKN